MRALHFDSFTFCQAPEMGLLLKYLPQFGNRAGVERNSDTKNNHTQKYFSAAAVHLSTLKKYTTLKNTPAWNKAIYVSTYFKESAQGHILHLYSGWQRRCAVAAFLFPRCRLHRNTHTSRAWKRAVWKLMAGAGTSKGIFFFLLPAPLMRLLLVNLTTTAE